MNDEIRERSAAVFEWLDRGDFAGRQMEQLILTHFEVDVPAMLSEIERLTTALAEEQRQHSITSTVAGLAQDKFAELERALSLPNPVAPYPYPPVTVHRCDHDCPPVGVAGAVPTGEVWSWTMPPEPEPVMVAVDELPDHIGWGVQVGTERETLASVRFVRGGSAARLYIRHETDGHDDRCIGTAYQPIQLYPPKEA